MHNGRYALNQLRMSGEMHKRWAYQGVIGGEGGLNNIPKKKAEEVQGNPERGGQTKTYKT